VINISQSGIRYTMDNSVIILDKNQLETDQSIDGQTIVNEPIIEDQVATSSTYQSQPQPTQITDLKLRNLVEAIRIFYNDEFNLPPLLLDDLVTIDALQV
jgi:hypothetical protein